jgi:hypothetical protein|nr:MAG TPA: hypothetical protein [Caudoviricetes sp.]
MNIECTEYQFDSIKSHTKEMDTNNFNIIQRANHLIINCQELQNKGNELKINDMIRTLSQIVEMATNNDFARIKIDDILSNFKQEVNK